MWGFIDINIIPHVKEGGAHGVIVIIIRNGLNDLSWNTGHSANILGKVMHPTVLPLAMSKLSSRFGSLDVI